MFATLKLLFSPSLRYHLKILDLREMNNELILRHWHNVRQVQPRLSGFLSVTSLSSPHEGHFLACQKVLSSVGEVNLMAVQCCSNSLKSEFAGLGSASSGDIRKPKPDSSAQQSQQKAGRTEKSTQGAFPEGWWLSCCAPVSVGHCGESLTLLQIQTAWCLDKQEFHLLQS